MSVSCRLPILQEEESPEAQLLCCVLALQCIAGHCLQMQSTQKELKEHAGLELLLLCLGHPNWARCKSTNLRYVLRSLTLSTTAYVEELVGRKISI